MSQKKEKETKLLLPKSRNPLKKDIGQTEHMKNKCLKSGQSI